MTLKSLFPTIVAAALIFPSHLRRPIPPAGSSPVRNAELPKRFASRQPQRPTLDKSRPSRGCRAALRLRRIRRHRVLSPEPSAGDALFFHPSRHVLLNRDTTNQQRIAHGNEHRAAGITRDIDFDRERRSSPQFFDRRFFFGSACVIRGYDVNHVTFTQQFRKQLIVIKTDPFLAKHNGCVTSGRT